MLLRDGVPLISELEALEDSAYYAEITGYSKDFLAEHADFKLERERELLPFVDQVDGARGNQGVFRRL